MSEPTSFQDFFDAALPNERGNHVLALGENHLQATHLHFLQTNLRSLIKYNRLGTIGLEMQPFMNVFFWAYQDGTMDKELGSHEASRLYLRTMIHLAENHAQAAEDRAALVLDALDQGLRVVAYDTRHPWKDWLEKSASALRELDEKIGPILLKNLRDEPEVAQSVLDKMPEFRQSWMVKEVGFWMDHAPAYRKALNGMERIIELGHKHGLNADAASALLFNAASDLSHNSIAIIGLGHMTGVQHTKTQTIAGLYPEFLAHQEAEGIPAPRVSKALIAGTAVGEFSRAIADDISRHGSRHVATLPIHHANLDTSTVTPLPLSYPARGVKPFDKAIASKEANPLRIPEMQRTVALLRQQFALLAPLETDKGRSQ